jgi:hypothetical protein
VLLTVIFAAPLLHAGSPEQQQAKIILEETGTYQILQRIGQDTIPKVIGSETYTKKTFSTNTIVFESRSKMDFTVIGAASGLIQATSRLEIEEDSYFPRRYHMRRTAKDVEVETSVEMVSNMAIISKRINDREEKATLTLSTGAMFIEGTLLHHRALLLHRFNSSLPGKQNVIIFDPHLKRETTAVIEFVGEEGVEIDGVMRTLNLFKVSIEKLAEMKLYMDEKGIVVRATNGSQDFILISFEEKSGENPAGG